MNENYVQYLDITFDSIEDACTLTDPTIKRYVCDKENNCVPMQRFMGFEFIPERSV